jgi:hypothetical protein
MWPFKKKPQPITLTLNKHFFLSVLMPPGTLPPVLQIVNPDGSNGAIQGFMVPMQQGATKDLLNQPINHGAYGILTKDKLTALELHIIPKKQISDFVIPDDEIVLAQIDLVGQKLARARQVQQFANIIIKGYHPEIYPTVQFFHKVTSRLAQLTDAVISDALAETYRLPQELQLSPKLDNRIDFREIGTIKAIQLQDGIWISTRGLVKFNLPEYEMYGITKELKDTAATMLASAAQQTLIGLPIKIGETAFAQQSPLEVVIGTKQRHVWNDRPTLEFKDPGQTTALKGVQAWKPFTN